TPAEFTVRFFDGHGLRDQRLARPILPASDSVSVRQVVVLLRASFRLRLATTPLRFANPSPPSGWMRDLHPPAVEHARHTAKRPREREASLPERLPSGYVLASPNWPRSVFTKRASFPLAAISLNTAA